MKLRRAMGSTLAVAIALLLGWGVGCAGVPPTAIPTTAASSFAWTAESPEPGVGPLVLMGSMHLGAGPIELGPLLSSAFARADVLVLELDPDGTGLLESLRLMAQYAQLPEGESLADYLSPESYEALRVWAERNDVGLASLTPFAPWIAATIVEMEEWKARGYEEKYGSERQFLRFAKQQGKPIEELESAQEQLSAISSVDMKTQEYMLEAALRAPDADYAEMARLWRSGDEEALAAFLTKDMHELGAQLLAERLMYERNQRMVERLVARSLDGRTRFVLVGVGHMVGERSIPEMFERRGYSVMRMRGESAP